MFKSKKQKPAKGSKNSNQADTKGSKGHRNVQQQSFIPEQDTHGYVEKGKFKNAHGDAESTVHSHPTDGRNATGLEDMDTSQNETSEQHTTYDAHQQYTTCGGYQQYTTHGGDQQYNTQGQAQQQLQRSLEASKQMLYGVFGNVITILEEYEKREMEKHQLQQQMPKSKFPIPDQSQKSFDDVKSIVETQLLLFQTQTKVCPPEAISEVLEDLKRRTIAWSAVRDEMGIKEVHVTDFYVTKLYEILATGKTEHPPLEKQEFSEETMREGFQAMLHGEHDREKLDKDFKTNKDKKASAPETRESEMLRDGAERISRARGNQDLDKFLQDDLKTFENQGPKDIK